MRRSRRSLPLRLRAGPLALSAALSSWVLSACAAPPASAPVLRIGLIGVMEGTPRMASGVPAEQGATLAVEEINAAGGVLIGGVAHQVALVSRATANRPDAAAATARELVNLDSVHALVGPQFSALAITAGVVAEASEVPMIAAMASSARVTEGKRFVNRLAFVDAVQGEVLAQYAWDSLGIRRTAALHNAASDYGRDIMTLYARTFTAAGGVMSATETYHADDAGPPVAQIRRILASRPDAVLLPNFTVRDSAQLRLLREGGFRGRLIAGDSWDTIALRSRVHALGAILVGNWDGRGARPEVTAFRRRYETRFPDATPRATAAATYDAIQLIARAAARAGAVNGPALATALRAPGRHDGAFARYTFNGTGDPVRGATIMEVGPDSLLLRVTLEPRR